MIMGEWMSTRCTDRGALPRTFLRSKYATQNAYFLLHTSDRARPAVKEGTCVSRKRCPPTNAGSERPTQLYIAVKGDAYSHREDWHGFVSVGNIDAQPPALYIDYVSTTLLIFSFYLPAGVSFSELPYCCRLIVDVRASVGKRVWMIFLNAWTDVQVLCDSILL